MTKSSAPDYAASLAAAGYAVVPGVLDGPLHAALTERYSDAALSAAAQENFGDAGGFLVADYRDPVVVSLLTWPQTLRTLQDMGYPAPKLHNFYVSAKPPHTAALPWHSDLFYQYEADAPAELFLIYYLQDTTPQNGCLRVVPGSHRWPHDQRHDQSHTAALRPDEVDVPVRAGDLFVGDRRILHATHANTTNAWRTCITIAYAPQFEALPEPIKALIVRNQCLPPSDAVVDPRLQPLLPVYMGTAPPVATT